jgi:hypothetical protein
LISRRAFILSTGVVAIAPRMTPLLSSEPSLSTHLISSDSLDMIQKKYPFASTATLRLACWDEFLDTENLAPDTSQFIHVTTSWRVI